MLASRVGNCYTGGAWKIVEGMQNKPDKSEPVGLDYIEQTLRNLGAFYFWQNDGNLGDYIIAEATRQLFRRSGVDWQPYDPENPPREHVYNLVYSGGGRFVPYWGGLELRQTHLTRAQVRRCVILPHSINGVDEFVRALDARHTVFCRERKTLAYCRSYNEKARFILAHDVGIFLNLDKVVPLASLVKPQPEEGEEAARQFSLLTGGGAEHARFRVSLATVHSPASGRKVAFYLREDGEKGIDLSSGWSYDLSGLWSGSCNENSCSGPLLMFMAELASYPDVVVTDRLHVAIMAMHVGKEVYMLDNDYGKLSGVYELSLKDRANVHLLPHGEPRPEEIQKAWEVLNAQEMKHTEPQRKVEGGALISVVVPVYNTAPWLRRCLDSICGQTYRNLEILCVDDGSTDGSAEILAEYAAMDARIKVFTQPNAGLSAARNTALEHASGEWVTGVDSDDYLETGVYERAVACIAPAVDMVFFGVVEVDETGAPLPFNRYFDLPAEDEYEMTPALAEKLNVCFWSKLWRRSVLEEHRLRFPHGLVHEDEAMYYLAAPFVRKIAVCPEIGYHYVQRGGSIMNEEGLTLLRRAQRHVPVLEFTAGEYKKRGMLKGSARPYLLKMSVRLCGSACWVPECRDVYAPFLRRYKLYHDDYRLERLLPVPRWLRLFVSRYPQSKVYRFCGVAVWCVCYSDAGRAISFHCMLLDRLVQFFR